MKITNELLKNYFICRFKAKYFLDKKLSKNSTQKQIEYFDRKIYQKFISHKKIHLQRLSLTKEQKFDIEKLVGEFEIEILDDNFTLNFPIVDIITTKKGNKTLKAYFFCSNNKVSKEEILYYKEATHILLKRLNFQSASCTVVYDHDLKIKNLKIDSNKNSTDFVNEFTSLQNDKDIKPNRISHCAVCELHKFCKEELIREDSIKLLGSISDKEVLKHHSRGIFTITQLSYTFKPRRKKKNNEVRKGRYLYELKALSLRENKTHVLNKQPLAEAPIELYIDFEGNLNHSVYLIGVILIRDGQMTNHYFWTDDEDSSTIFSQFFEFIFSLNDDFYIYHYGSYEIKAIQKINQKFSILEEDKIDFLKTRMVNLLNYFYSHVFPPTYTNSLKEIAQYIGFQWSRKQANGIQANYWRNNWLEHKTQKGKRKLLIYNMEDCLALIKLKEWLSLVFEEKIKDVISDTRKHLKSKSSKKYRKNQFIIQDFQEVNDLAYFNYQRDKVIIRDKGFKKKFAPKSLLPKYKDKINSQEYPLPPNVCPRCGNPDMIVHESRSRVIIDLKIQATGIRKNCILFHARRFRCKNCLYTFMPKKYKGLSRYGYNLRIWIIHQLIIYSMSCKNIEKSLSEYFQVMITDNTIRKIRSEFANHYSKLIDELTIGLKKGNLIQGDETKINLRQESGYIWVFTNLNTVLYFYQPNREAKFLQDFLEGFNGVLLSDFYAAYDSIECPQQKCLVHLIRDINDDLFQNQTNEDLQYLAQAFGVLMKKIVGTIDKYGLKKRNLNKHHKDVDKFYQDLQKQEFNTELGKKWLKRFLKNEEKLFTFLSYDGVPWNNNNAEHAIKTFALHRREINGYYGKQGMEEFLVLLSISETCKFRGISFWEFLKSKKTSFE